MDQHRDVPATDGWGDAISDGQAERAQLRTRVNELHKIMDRLRVLRPEYQKLIKTAQQGLRAAHDLEGEMNTFAISIGLSPVNRLPG